MNPIWVDHNGSLVGRAPLHVFDPGVGPDRYRTALEGLRESGREVAFASFTFDEEEPGSVVIVPETVGMEHVAPGSDGGEAGIVVDDGIAAWRDGYRKAMAAIGSGQLAKVVLTRRVEIEMTGQIDTRAIVTRLAAGNPGCYLFAIEGLIGASPELLVSLHEGRLRTLTLAGTATNPRDLETHKIAEEHRHAADSVRDGLVAHMAEIEVTERMIVDHGVMSHVGTRIEGRAIPTTTVADVLVDLHPTAAVAGTPRDLAVKLIREVEPRSRGRYAGPIGWLNTAGDGVFAVALRCGQIDGKRVTLHGGGGLVEGSIEDQELAETGLKLAPMMNALGQPAS